MSTLVKTIFSLAIILFASVGVACSQTCFNDMDDYLSKALPGKAYERSQEFLKRLIGCEAPDFSLIDTRYEKWTLSSLKGRVIVINFWQIDSPNIAQIPALNKLTEEYKNKDVVFIAFGRDNLANILDFLKTTKFDYHLIPIDEDFAERYCVVGWPMNMVLDKDGIVRKVFIGARINETASTWAYDEMKPIIDKYLEN